MLDARRIGTKQWGLMTGEFASFADQDGGSVAIDRCKFSYNVAGHQGGAVA